MPTYPDRKDRIYVLTVDPVLAADVQERLAFDPHTRGCELLRPVCKSIKAGVAEIEALARQTLSSRLLIFDVRSYTLPRLQHAYNRIVGYNRKELNLRCHSLLIGDGPLNLFHAGKSLHVFAPHLASHRIDYSPSVFFYDPLLHYTSQERPMAGIDRPEELPRFVPKRLERAFEGQNVPLAEAREYFRAAGLSGQARRAAMERRQERLVRFYRKRIAQEFPHHHQQAERWLSKQGCDVAGETLRLHLYPLFFEQWVSELMAKSTRPPGEAPGQPGRPRR